MRVLVIVAAIVVPGSPARAEARLGVHSGGGLEGGLIDHAAAPTWVAAVGLSAEWLLPGHDVGVGLTLESVARPGHDLAQYEEDTLDLTLRFALPSRAARFGVGMGARSRTADLIDGEPQPPVTGMDFIRLEIDAPLVRRALPRGELSVDGYFAWTYGCYFEPAHPRGAPPMPSAGCLETMTSAYVFGLAISVASGR